MSISERSISLDCLLKVFYRQEFSDKLLDNACKKISDPKKRSFFTRLFLGTLENAIFIDKVIKNASNRRVKDIQRTVLNILRQSIYELLFMDSVPDAPCISSALKLCEERKLFKAKGFVNGVLGNVAREKSNYLNMELSLHEKYSFPKWIVEYYKTFLSDETIENILKNIHRDHTLTIRINRDKISVDDFKNLLKEKGIDYELILDLPAIRILAPIRVVDIPGFSEGLFYVQDKSSIEAVAKIGVKENQRVIDVCSAPGGKGLFAAELVGNGGFVSLRDKSKNKTDIIRENARRLGINNIEILEYDARNIDESIVGKMDVVIADLPCSGLGTIGKKPELKYRLKPEDIDALRLLQRDILSVASKYLKEKGRMLFSTCTISIKENDENLNWFLEKNNDFSLVEKKQILPDENGGDGFFYAVLEKHG